MRIKDRAREQQSVTESRKRLHADMAEIEGADANEEEKQKGKSNKERKREAKQRQKAFLASHGIYNEDSPWAKLLMKEKLTPLERM